MDKMEERVKSLENSVKFAKAMMGGLGITAIALFGYVFHLKTEADKSIGEVKSFEIEAVHNLQNESLNQIRDIKTTGDDVVGFIEEEKDKLFTEKCTTTPIKLDSCKNRNEWLSCPDEYYLKSVKNRGDTNSCVSEIKCCSVFGT